MRRSRLLRLLASSDAASRPCFAYQILSNMQLRGVDFRGAVLRWADLRCSDLRDANLSHAQLEFACLKGADLTGADLGGACLKGADLSHAQLEGASGVEEGALFSVYRSPTSSSDRANVGHRALPGTTLFGHHGLRPP